MFHDNQNEVTKVVLKPGLAPTLAGKDAPDV
jgi:hypothetical protein